MRPLPVGRKVSLRAVLEEPTLIISTSLSLSNATAHGKDISEVRLDQVNLSFSSLIQFGYTEEGDKKNRTRRGLLSCPSATPQTARECCTHQRQR